ncbi:MAG: four helix bundle protein, partial [Acidobacteria bacterium]|nr:four helix bundle protein [Acidobacteriota bacterium]
SAAELETQLLPAGRLGYIKGNTAETVQAKHSEIERMLDSLIRSLKTKIDPRHGAYFALCPFNPMPPRSASEAS